MLVRAGKELCFDCHDDVLGKATFRHKPVESGECSTCHNPHASTNKFLLTRSGQSLCFDCHQSILTTSVKFKHAPAAMGECTFCHNSHSSDNKFLLARTGPKLCFDCHEDFLTRARVKHPAVENCSACHFSHQSNERLLLVKESQQLCYGCHVRQDMVDLKGHAGMGDASCLKCHDPHSGTDRYLLKPGVTRPGFNQAAAQPSATPTQ
jgi:predicted CXXCH cytochrome family protein